MADVDEDAAPSSFHSNAKDDDNDAGDELQDFRFLAAVTSGAGDGKKIPKRGEKDFEAHGTKHQEAVLEASRQAMHDALGYTRTHPPRSNCRAWYFGDGVFDENEVSNGDEGPLSEVIRGKGLNTNHVVMVESPNGIHYKTMGKTALGKEGGKLWLLPEEALYLVERGNLDLWWPSRPMSAMFGQTGEYGVDQEEGEDDGLPLSLQAAYALLIGEDGHDGTINLEKFIVYSNLKRSGYVVLRNRPWDSSTDGGPSGASLFTRLFGGLFGQKLYEPRPYGPLARPGLYRSYHQIYQLLSIIPSHQPSPSTTTSAMPAEEPFRLAFDVWKPSRIPGFAKTKPGLPDVRVAVVSSRSTTVPSLQQMRSLVESAPWEPPPKEWTGVQKSFQRLKHGYRNVVLAIVDGGIISYLRMSEAAFGEEKLYSRFDSNVGGSGRKGGGRSRGRGTGRGRGRGRGR